MIAIILSGGFGIGLSTDQPKINVSLQEVGLTGGLSSRGVGGVISTPSTRDPWEAWWAAA